MAARQQIQDQLTIRPAILRVVADPLRSFLVHALVPEAKTVRQLGVELSCPPTRLYYHLQQLQKHGLVFVERTRLVSGIREKHYRATARELLLDRSDLDAEGVDQELQRQALLGFVFDQSRIEIARGLHDGRIDPRKRAPQVDALIAYRNVLRLSPGQAERLYQRLHEFWQEYEQVAREPAPDGDFYAFAVALYPNQPAAGTQDEPAGAGTDTGADTGATGRGHSSASRTRGQDA